MALRHAAGRAEDVELWAWHAPSLRGPWSEYAWNPGEDGRPWVAPRRLFAHEGASTGPRRTAPVRTDGRGHPARRPADADEFAEEPTAILESPRSPFPRPHPLPCWRPRTRRRKARRVRLGELRAFPRDLGARPTARVGPSEVVEVAERVAQLLLRDRGAEVSVDHRQLARGTGTPRRRIGQSRVLRRLRDDLVDAELRGER